MATVRLTFLIVASFILPSETLTQSRCFRNIIFEGEYQNVQMIPILSNNNYTHAILDYGANINLFRGSERREILSFPDGPIVNHVDVLSNLLVETHKIEMIQIGLKKDMVALSFSISTYFVIYVWYLSNLVIK